jgi:hypothetical protein
MMSAIRFRFNGAAQILSLIYRESHTAVIIRLQGGKEQRVECAGFICKHAINHMPEGNYAKIIACSVTADTNPHTGDWKTLERDQVVLGWRVMYTANKESRWKVYVIVDPSGCPVVVTDKSYKPPPGPKLAGVRYLSDKRAQKSHGKSEGNVA